MRFLSLVVGCCLLAGCASAPKKKVTPLKAVRMPPSPFAAKAARAIQPPPPPALNVPPVAHITIGKGTNCCPPQPPDFWCPEQSPGVASTPWPFTHWREGTNIVIKWIPVTNYMFEVQFTHALGNLGGTQWWAYARTVNPPDEEITVWIPIYKCDSRFYRITSMPVAPAQQANVLDYQFTGEKPSFAVEGVTFETHPDTWAYTNNPILGQASVGFTDRDNRYASAAFFYLSNQFDTVFFKFYFKALRLPDHRSIEVQDIYDITPQGYSGHEAMNIYLHPDGRFSLYLGPDSIPAYTDVYYPPGELEITGSYSVSAAGSEGQFSWAMVGSVPPIGNTGHCFGSYTWPSYKFLWGPVEGSLFGYAYPRVSTLPF